MAQWRRGFDRLTAGLLAVAALLCTVLPARAQYTTPTYNGLIVNGAIPIYPGQWTTAGRPSCNSAAPVPGSGSGNTGFLGGFGFNTSTLSMEQCVNGSWAPMGGGGTPGGTNGQVQYNNSGALGGLTNTQLTADINVFSSTLSGAVPAGGGSSTTLFLNQAGGWASPSGGTGCSVSAGCTYAGNVLFLAGAGGVYASNTGSPAVTSGLGGQGALEWNDPSWQPGAAIAGTPVYSAYNLLYLASIGHGSGTVAQKWAGKMSMLYLEGVPQVSGGTSTAAGTSLNGIIVATHIPAGLASGGGIPTFSGGAPVNTAYFEWSTITGIFEAASAGYYNEGFAQYNCDTVDCAAGSVGVNTRMTGFLAATYKNYGAISYGTTGFFADSLGSQQGVNGAQYAPESAFRADGGWLTGVDFHNVCNIGGITGGTNVCGIAGATSVPSGFGFVPMSLPFSSSISFDSGPDIQFWLSGALVQNIGTASVTFDQPIFIPGLPTGSITVGGGAACFTSAGKIVFSSGANCYAGGGTAGGAPLSIQYNSSGSLAGYSPTTLTQTILLAYTGSAQGLVPANSGSHGATYYLDATGNWSVPSGGGGAVSSVSNSDGSLTISPTTGVVVASLNTTHPFSFSGGVTITSSGGGLSLGSPLAQVYGGFGYSVIASATNGSLCIGATGFGCGNSTITAGAGITVTNGANSITLATAANIATATTYTATGVALAVNNHFQIGGSIYLSGSGSAGGTINGNGGSTEVNMLVNGVSLLALTASSAIFQEPVFIPLTAAVSGTKTACLTASGEITWATGTCPP